MTNHHLSSGEERQRGIEEDALNAGLAHYRERTTRMEQNGLASLTDYGTRLIQQTIEPLIHAIDQFKAEAQTKPGPKHLAFHLLSQIESDVAAFFTARSVCDSIATAQTLQTTALGIASRIEEELRCRSFLKDAPALFKKVQQNLKDHPMGYQRRVKSSTMIHAGIKFNVRWKRWERSDKLHLGIKLVELFIAATGLVELDHRVARKDTTLFLKPGPALSQWITEYKSKAELLCPELLPMVCPPKPWTTPSDGGYLTKRLARRLVRTNRRSYLKELRHADMPTVYAAVNTLQETAWRVSPAMWTVVQEIWEAGLEVKGLPSRFDTPLPPKPFAEVKDRDLTPDELTAYVAWKTEAANIFRNNQKAASQRMQAAKIMYLAGKFSEFPAVWFPAYLDFRGRMYPTPQDFNPQGCDLSKGLLTFAERKPLGKRGAFWLGVHLANCFGYDKCSLQERYEWVVQHSARIESTANDPLEDRWWMEADKPFQFLAACIEWLGYLTDGGENYVCSLPIMVDGSCNGLQHFSAMLRDEVAGRHVNLTPADKPADIYQAVADAVTARLAEEAAAGVEFAAEWVAYGVSRKMAKRPVMVLPYGGTMSAVREYLLAAVHEGKPHPFDHKLKLAVIYLAKVFWKVMAEVVVGPRKAMDWLRNAARVVNQNKTKLPITWTTPTGFIVHQAYADRKRHRIKTKMGDQIVYLSLDENLEKIDGRRQVQAISPNFVHSLDAAALAHTLVGAYARGVRSFAAIHDSYGTLPADMDGLTVTLRECFVRMYERFDVLADFAAEVSPAVPDGQELAPPPARGSLDLSGVLKSDFFFS